MRTLSLLLAVAGTLGAFAANSGTIEGLESYGDLTLVDSIDCSTDTTHAFRDFPVGNSYVTNILGRGCRVLHHVKRVDSGRKNDKGETIWIESGAYISWRLGAGKKLKANDPYLLVVDYPDDAPRSATVMNYGAPSRRGFHTGATLGDAESPPYVMNFLESFNIPFTGTYQQIEQVMFPCEKPEKYDGSGTRLALSEDGFDLSFALFPDDDAPGSLGVAVSAIRLYHIDDEAALKAEINYPAGDLPRRVVTWREEMSDDNGHAAYADRMDFYRAKSRLMDILAINTYSKDQLEFGYCQGWDPTYHDYGSGWMNYNAEIKDDWGKITEIMGKAGHWLLPYFEYAGGRGAWNSLGDKKLATPLKDGAQYSNAYWVDDCRVDITSEEAKADFKRILDCTVLRYKDNAKMLGSWIRNRGQMPVSFHDNTVALFCKETGRAAGSVTRSTIAKAGESSDIYKEYRAWWYGKRAEFLEEMRKYLEDNGIENAKSFYTSTIAETGEYGANWWGSLVVNDATEWQRILKLTGQSRGNGESVGAATWSYRTYCLNADWPTWGNYEQEHAAPHDDPATYAKSVNVALTYPFNRVYTVVRDKDGTADDWRNGSGDLFFVRFHSLNENNMFDANGKAMCGYYTADFEKAGPACMLSELWAMAVSDPNMLGYLCGFNMARNFTLPARKFNQNFLSLPATKSEVVYGQGGYWGASLTVRKWTTDAGNYFAVINTSANAYTSKNVGFAQYGGGKVYETVSRVAHDLKGDGSIDIDIGPYEMIAFSTVKPGEVVVRPTAPTVPVDQIEVTNGYGQVSLVVPVSSLGTLGTSVSVAVEVTDDANKTVFAQTNEVTAVGTVAFAIPGLSPSTHYSWRVDAANEHGKSTSASGEFTTARYPVALDAAIATVAADGKSAVLSCGFAHLDEPSARVTLTLNGAEVKTWEGADAATGLSTEVAVRVGTTNVFAFAAVLPSGAQAMSEGAFVARVFNEWFRVDHQPTDRGTWTIPEALQASVGTSGGQAVLLLTGGEDLEELPRVAYAPETSSPTGLETVVSGRIKVAPCERAPDLSGEPEAKGGVCFLNGAKGAEPYGFANGAWHQLSGGSEIADGAWIDYEVKFDFANGEGPQMSYTVGDWTSERLAYGSQTKSISQFFFVNPKEIGCFMGVYYTLKGEGGVEITDADAPVFVVDGEAAFGLSPSEGGEAGSRTFSITIGNPVKGAYYTVFTTTSLAGDVPFTAERDSTPFSPESAAETLVLTFDADAPAKFAKVVVSSEPFAQGAILP